MFKCFAFLQLLHLLVFWVFENAIIYIFIFLKFIYTYSLTQLLNYYSFIAISIISCLFSKKMSKSLYENFDANMG